MKYTTIYNSSYQIAYDKFERLTKKFFIISNKEDRSYNYFRNTFSYESSKAMAKRLDLIYHMPGYPTLMEKFERRNKNYSRNQIERVFENEIYIAFVEISKEKLPKNYNFCKLVFDFAVIQAYQDLQSTVVKNSELLELIYKLEKFELFKVRKINETSIYENSLYLELSKIEKPTTSKKPDIIINSNLIADKLFEFLVEHYKPNNIQQIKFINIWHFLKRDVDLSKYVYNPTQNDYKLIIKEKYDVDIKKFEKSDNYFEKVKPVLRDLEYEFDKK